MSICESCDARDKLRVEQSAEIAALHKRLATAEAERDRLKRLWLAATNAGHAALADAAALWEQLREMRAALELIQEPCGACEAFGDKKCPGRELHEIADRCLAAHLAPTEPDGASGTKGQTP